MSCRVSHVVMIMTIYTPTLMNTSTKRYKLRLTLARVGIRSLEAYENQAIVVIGLLSNNYN
ncbi:hypothetical protein ALT717_40318 [Alteromonas macleodii]